SQSLLAFKSLNRLAARTETTLTLNNPGFLDPGQPLSYTVKSSHVSDSPGAGSFQIRAILEKKNSNDTGDDSYSVVDVIYDNLHDYSVDGDIDYTDTYQPALPVTQLPTGDYRVRLEVLEPRGYTETQRFQFFYKRSSGFSVRLNQVESGGEPITSITAGGTYTIPLEAANNHPDHQYAVQNGNYLLVLETESGEEVLRKEASGITINSGEQKQLQETFTFNPPGHGYYYLKFKYWDETREEPGDLLARWRWLYKTLLTVRPDKTVYNYLETAGVAVNLRGTGTYRVRFTSPEAGMDEVRLVQVPQGEIRAVEVFQLPIGLLSLYSVVVEVNEESAPNIKFQSRAYLWVNPITLDYHGTFKESIARAGLPLELDVNINGTSGVSVPVAGTLTVTSSALNINETRSVTLQPGQDNPFNFSFPIAVETVVGNYPVDVKLVIAGVEFIGKRHYIELPAARLNLGTPGTSFNAGDSITLTMENSGGKSGTFDVETLLKDSSGKIVVQSQQDHTLSPGSTETVTIAIPSDAAGGRYVLVQNALETATNSTVKHSQPLDITGLTAVMNSYTLKSKYFDSEIITGKSEMTLGALDIQNGSLEAGIVKLNITQAIEKLRAQVLCLALGIQDKIWVGTDSGISRYDGTDWFDYDQLLNGDPIGTVTSIIAGPGNQIHGLTQNGIVKISGSQITLIPHYFPNSDAGAFTVDENSRVWVVGAGVGGVVGVELVGGGGAGVVYGGVEV
ncbi:MAG: hypothetical protein GY940_23525, partial [bacterium]|nr:hypothetical protein [bacterium]